MQDLNKHEGAQEQIALVYEVYMRKRWVNLHASLKTALFLIENNFEDEKL